MKRNPLDLLIAAVLAVAFLAALLVKGGWLLSIPILLALAVIGYLAGAAYR